MSEKLRHHELLPAAKHELLTAHTKHEKAPAVHKHNAHEKAQEARETIADTASRINPLERFEDAEKASQPAPILNVNQELKQITLSHELQQIRRRLPKPQQALSKVIHQPIVRVASEFVGSTASRPSGILGGGLVALVGTSVYLYMAKHNGFSYNYTVFLILFVGGFLLGLILEFAVYSVALSRRKSND